LRGPRRRGPDDLRGELEPQRCRRPADATNPARVGVELLEGANQRRRVAGELHRDPVSLDALVAYRPHLERFRKPSGHELEEGLEEIVVLGIVHRGDRATRERDGPARQGDVPPWKTIAKAGPIPSAIAVISAATT